MAHPESEGLPAARPWWTVLLPRGLRRRSKFSTGPIRVSVHQSLLPQEDLAHQVLGLGGSPGLMFGVWRKRLWQYGEERAADVIRETGAVVSSLGWTGGFTGSMGFSFREAVADCRTAIEEAAELNARTVVIVPGARGGHTMRHAQRLVIDGVRKLVEQAAEHRIRLALLVAPPHRGAWSFLSTIGDAGRLMRAINSPHVGLACPLYLWDGVESTPEAMDEFAPYVDLVWSTLAVQQKPVRKRDLLSAAAPASRALSRLMHAGFTGVWELHGETVAAPTNMTSEQLIGRCRPYIEAVLRGIPQAPRRRGGTQAERRAE